VPCRVVVDQVTPVVADLVASGPGGNDIEVVRQELAVDVA
jgi:hypothetical protein